MQHNGNSKEFAVNLNLDAAWILRLGLAIADNPVQSAVLIAGVVGLADIPVLQDRDLFIRGRGDGVIEVTVDTHESILVEHNLLLIVGWLEQGHGDVGGRVNVEAHGLGFHGCVVC